MVKRPLTFGIQTPQIHSWETMVASWQSFEDQGWESIWLPDHFVPTFRPELPLFDAWTLLPALAHATSKVRLGALVTCNTFRHPSLLAKQAVTLDHISGGRLELGLGTGWVEFEHTMFGVPYPDAPERVSRFGEAIAILDLLMQNDTASFTGKHYQLQDAVFRPGPIQKPRPPFTLAAHGPKMLSLIAPYVDRWNSMGTPKEMAERGSRLDEALMAHGRDPDTVIKSLLYVPTIIPTEKPWASPDAFRDFVGRYQDIGVTDFIMQVPPSDDQGIVESIARDVLSGLR